MKKLTLIASMFLLAMSLGAQPAHAQFPWSGGSTDELVRLSYSFTSAGIALGVSSTIAITVVGFAAYNDSKKTRVFLENNEQNLRELASVGSSAGLKDLGAFLQIPEAQHKALGKHIRGHKKEMQAILKMPSTDAKGARFLVLVAPFLPANTQVTN